MSNINQIINENKDFKTFAGAYAQYMSKLLAELDLDALKDLADELEDARANKKTVFVIGNGGSASTASHIVNDLAFGVRRHIEPSLNVVSLTDNCAVLTALANDVGYEEVFLRQLKVYFNRGDKLIVISASGNSPNLVVAAKWVKEQGGQVLGLLGFDGGALKDICHSSVVVATPKGEYGPVEDVHMILNHLLYTWLWWKIRQTAS